jgi:hypothetical protein
MPDQSELLLLQVSLRWKQKRLRGGWLGDFAEVCSLRPSLLLVRSTAVPGPLALKGTRSGGSRIE